MSIVCSPLTGWQYVVLQNADATPRYLYSPPGKIYPLYRRTLLGDELAEQLGVMADRLGWEPA